MHEFWLCLLPWNPFPVVNGFLKNVSNDFSSTLGNYEAALINGLLEYHGYYIQEQTPSTILFHLWSLIVQNYFLKLNSYISSAKKTQWKSKRAACGAGAPGCRPLRFIDVLLA